MCSNRDRAVLELASIERNTAEVQRIVNPNAIAQTNEMSAVTMTEKCSGMVIPNAVNTTKVPTPANKLANNAPRPTCRYEVLSEY